MSETPVFRHAGAAESDLLADIVIGEPDQETTRVAMLLYAIPDFHTAQRLFRLAWRAGANWQRSELAIVDGECVGVLQDGGSSARVSPSLLLSVARLLGPAGLLRLRARLAVHRRVVPEKPPRAYVVSEIHVAPKFRGRGLGQEIMKHARDRAREGGFEVMALHTLATNPAQRFYERCGFRLVGDRTDPEFERLTGCPGNVLYVRRA